MKLKFRDIGSGFMLQADEFDKSKWDQYDDTLSGEFGEDILLNKKGEIVYYFLTIINGPQDIQLEIKEAIKFYTGWIFYDVPDLGIASATFPEVLEAVRQYYLNKAARKEAVPA